MNRSEKDAAFFENWGMHRYRYFSKKAMCPILAYSSFLLLIFINLDIVINPHLLIPFILIASSGIFFIAIYLVLSNPPTA